MSLKHSFFLLIVAIIIKFLALIYTNLDLFGDEAQYWLWSKNLDLGYYSKPPLLAWVLGGFNYFVGNSFVAIKLVPFVFYFLTSYLIYLLSLELFNNKKLAVFTALTFYLMPAVSVSSFLVSTDVVLVFFWCLSLLFLLKIRKNKSLNNFFLLGIFLGLSFLAKYAAVYFLLSFFIFLFVDNATRKIFLKNIVGFLIFVFSAVVVVMPNIFWNINNNWVTFSHTSENAGLNRANLNFLQGIEFILLQGIMLGPLVFFAFFVYVKKIKFDFQTKFLTSFSLPIFLIVFVESILVRANANWAAVALIAFFLLIVNHVYIFSKKILIYNNFVNFVFCSVLFFLIGASSPVSFLDRISGISAFAKALESNHLQDKNVLVVEDRLLYSNLKYIFRNKDFSILTPHDPGSEIKSHFQISDPLKNDFNNNFLFLGNVENINYLSAKHRVRFVEKKNVKFRALPIKIYEVVF